MLFNPWFTVSDKDINLKSGDYMILFDIFVNLIIQKL